ncbi:MAG: hypothetical protein H6Q67_333 [Firmicutes bacterium]|nr:hypothetical protein [Bacillota bacterium]
MMRRLRIALALALIGGALTMAFAVYRDVSTPTLIYRTVCSIVLFGAGGYVLLLIIEPMLKTEAEDITEGQQLDAVSDNKKEETEMYTDADIEFSPFTPEQFDRISDKGE